MRRREFIAGLGAAAWVSPARAQQSAVPVIGFVLCRIGRYLSGLSDPVPQRPWRNRLCRGPERDGRVSLVGRPIRSPAGADG